VIVVTGAGKAFCAGADLGDGSGAFVSADGKTKMLDHRDEGGQVVLAFYHCPKPVIAAINGSAVGIGITMTLGMDFRVVAENAKIGFVFVRRGIIPEAVSSYLLPRVVGIAKATDLILTGRIFEPRTEERSGLFHHILPSADVMPKAMEIATEIVKNTSAISVALSKAMLHDMLGSSASPEAAHLLESKLIHWTGAREDAREGVISFLEKRSPQFPMKLSDLPDFYPWWTKINIKSHL